MLSAEGSIFALCAAEPDADRKRLVRLKAKRAQELRAAFAR